MVPHRVLASWRHQRGEAGDKVFGFEAERRRAVAPWVPQREHDAVFGVDAQAGQGDGWAQDVPAKSLKSGSVLRARPASCLQAEVAIGRFVPSDSP
jgi:hypothetical protein